MTIREMRFTHVGSLENRVPVHTGALGIAIIYAKNRVTVSTIGRDAGGYVLES